MTTKELIRREIERRITDNTFGAKLELIDVLAWLDTLEEPVSDDLEEAAEEYADLNCHNHVENETDWNGLLYAFKAGAEWMKKQIPMPEDTVIFQKGVEEGRRLEREDMMEVAVETYYGYVNNTTRVFLPEKTLKGVKEGYNRIIILKDYEETK